MRAGRNPCPFHQRAMGRRALKFTIIPYPKVFVKRFLEKNYTIFYPKICAKS
jgi:hypothetical protein